MITETTKLVATFMKSDNKKHNWSYNDVDTSLSAQEIKDICVLMTTLDLFEQDGVKLFDSAVSAKFVHRREIPIFDNTLEEELPTENLASTGYPHVNYVDTVENTSVFPTKSTETIRSTDLPTKESLQNTKAITMNEDLPAFMVSSSQLPARTLKTNMSEIEENYSASNKIDIPVVSDNQIQGEQKKDRRLKRFFTRSWGNHRKDNEDSS